MNNFQNLNPKANYTNISQKKDDKQKRNYGIDLLRIFAMINIINIHINIRTGLLYKNSDKIKFKKSWLLQSFSYSAVNSFGLISGIVGYNRFKFSYLIYLWFISSFYSVGIHTYLYFKNLNNITQLLFSFFPILTRFHWYVNAYFIMYLFLPFINIGIKSLNVKTFRNLLNKNVNYNFLGNGYSSKC